MQRIFFTALLAIAAFTVSAQKYTTAAGIRVGSGIGLTVQQKLFDSYTAEAILQKSLLKNETYASALFEQHIKLLTKGLNIYVGIGPHLAINKINAVNDKTGSSATFTSTGYGVSAIGGLEMRLKRVVFSIDYLPSVNIKGGDNVFNSRTGISARYILVKAKTKKKEQNWMFWKKWKSNRQADEEEWN